MNRCKTCKYFTPSGLYVGECSKIIDISDNFYEYKEEDKSNNVYIRDYEGYQATSEVGINYGCVHHEERE